MLTDRDLPSAAGRGWENGMGRKDYNREEKKMDDIIH